MIWRWEIIWRRGSWLVDLHGLYWCLRRGCLPTSPHTSCHRLGYLLISKRRKKRRQSKSEAKEERKLLFLFFYSWPRKPNFVTNLLAWLTTENMEILLNKIYQKPINIIISNMTSHWCLFKYDILCGTSSRILLVIGVYSTMVFYVEPHIKYK